MLGKCYNEVIIKYIKITKFLSLCAIYSLFKTINDLQKVLRKAGAALLFQIFRHSVESFRNAAGDTGECVAVTAE